jgi:hypothetical protein
MGPDSNHNYDNILPKKKKSLLIRWTKGDQGPYIHICHDHELVTYTM